MLGLSPLFGEVSGSPALGKLPVDHVRRLSRKLVPSVLALTAFSNPAAAQAIVDWPLAGQTPITALGAIQFAIFSGVMGAALLSAIALIRLRARSLAENTELKARVGELSSALARSEALLNLKDQRIVVWPTDGSRPSVVGDLPAETGAPLERGPFLAYGRLLTAKSAAALERAWEALTSQSTSFDMVVETSSGALLEVQGRRSALHSVLRFSSFSALQDEHARLKLEIERLRADHENLLALADELKMPLWLRDEKGKLRWVNKAYAQAVEAATPQIAVSDGRELLPAATREMLVQQQGVGEVAQAPVTTVVKGERRIYNVVAVAGREGTAGIASDGSEIEALRKEFDSLARSHADTLDKLT